MLAVNKEISGLSFLAFAARLRYKITRILRRRACSSADRATDSGSVGRRFESSQARFFSPLFAPKINKLHFFL
jgi:hypothetical protein